MNPQQGLNQVPTNKTNKIDYPDHIHGDRPTMSGQGPIQADKPITIPNFLALNPVVLPIGPKNYPDQPTEAEIEGSFPLRFISPSGRVGWWARVYSRPKYGACAVHGEWGHDAWVFLGTEEVEFPEFLKVVEMHDPQKERPDIEWPTECACGVSFTGRDIRCIYSRMLYTDGQSEFIPEYSPPGSVINSDWAPTALLNHPQRRHNIYGNPDEHDLFCLSVITPSGWWPIDIPDPHGNIWMRTAVRGNLSDLTVDPAMTLYGGKWYIRKGVLYPYLR